MARKKGYRFEDRSRYGRGIISTVTSAVSIVIFLSTVFICMVMAGKAPQWIGALGFSGFVMGFYGMIVGLESFRERNESYMLSKVGTLMGGTMVAVWFIIFCVGIA
ncbi:MAG TPA: hypothetical protein DHV42_05715 [Lachnospiraceae bacterium]|nr:hypothetical protein [Lachnospiraceae bacterium]